jgi:Arc/MetJ-type ribon-helix-helix transcriptional regulator
MPTTPKLNEKMVEEAVKLGNFKSKQEALNAALTEFVQRRNRLRILELAGKIDFDPNWNYKKMRGKR